MKVGTDAVLLATLASPDKPPASILDVGTGCGVIALILAQRFEHAQIMAIDIDGPSVHIASENFERSPWSQRLSAHQCSLQQLARNTGDNANTTTSEHAHPRFANSIPSSSFDMIVSNPPYFSHSLKNDDPRKRLARHDDQLPLEALFADTRQLLKPRGTLSLILPFEQHDHTLQTAQILGWTLHHWTTIHNQPSSPAKRAVYNFVVQSDRASSEILPTPHALHMRDADNSYSEAYYQLTSPYYLWRDRAKDGHTD